MKRGDTFSKTFQLSSTDVSDWSTWEGRGQIRAFFEDGQLIAELEFSWVDAAQGLFKIEAHNTEDWPTGKHVYDIEFTNGEFVFSTPTRTIDVTADVTKDGP